jgi:hypothetical protein
LRVGDHPLEASQLGLNRLLGVNGCFAHGCFSVLEREWNRLRDDTHEPCGLRKLKPSVQEFENVSAAFSFFCPTRREAADDACENYRPLLVTYANKSHHRRDNFRNGDRDLVGGPSYSPPLRCLIVFTGEFQKFGFECLPFRFGVAIDLPVEPCVSRNIQPSLACFPGNSACFLRGHRCPNISPRSRPNMLRITRRTYEAHATVREQWPRVASTKNRNIVDE